MVEFKMSIPIHYLKWVIMLCSLTYPLFFVEIVNVVTIRVMKKRVIDFIRSPTLWISGLILAFGMPLSIIYLDSPHFFYVHLPSPFFYILSVACVPVVILVEFLVGYCIVCFKRRVFLRPRLSIHSAWQGVPSYALILLIIHCEHMCCFHRTNEIYHDHIVFYISHEM